MSWVQFPDGLRFDPVAKRSPEALVVLLHDVGASAATLVPIAERWAPAVPMTAFVALDRIDGTSGDPTALNSATRHLELLLEQQLCLHRLDASRLVLIGFGHGGTLALHRVLHRGWGCAGVLAFAARLIRPLPRTLRIACKLRLIETVAPGPVVSNGLREVVSLLTARGIDTRGVLLGGPELSDEAIRHGGAYLVELVATAQRGNHFHFNRENNHELPARRT